MSAQGFNDTIKLIVVDMDGTFLNDQMTYDIERFKRQYALMKERNIKFVVASGNQYYQLKSFFEPFQDELAYVAENGALVVDEAKIIHVNDIPGQVVDDVIACLQQHPSLRPIICGVNSAYILNDADEALYNNASRYYHRLKKIGSYDEIDDVIIKFALTTPDVSYFENQLTNQLPREITLVTSGHDSIDLISNNSHKAAGIAKLLTRWQTSFDKCMAFGDSNNDLEMLHNAKYSYAMANGNDNVKRVANYIAPSNNEHGVLRVIDEYLNR